MLSIVQMHNYLSNRLRAYRCSNFCFPFFFYFFRCMRMGMGPTQLTITRYKIQHAGEKATHSGNPKQRKFKFGWTKSLCCRCPSGLYHVTVCCIGPIPALFYRTKARSESAHALLLHESNSSLKNTASYYMNSKHSRTPVKLLQTFFNLQVEPGCK